jgi:hypothetical protein
MFKSFKINQSLYCSFFNKSILFTGRTKAKAVQLRAPIKLINSENLGTEIAIIAVNKTIDVLIIRLFN